MLRKAFVLSLALLAVFAAAAQAHTATASVSCGSVTITWLDFADSGAGNGGLNTPTYSVTFTPTAGGAPTVFQGQASSPNGTFSLPFTIPAVNGTVVASSAWTAAQTRDNITPGSVSGTFNVTSCPPPAISTTATPASATLGAALTDVAQISGLNAPTGTITFKLYGPNDATCSAANPPTVTTPVTSGNGSYTSPPISPTAAGTYRWVASYGGDANNKPISGACGDANETAVVTPVTPSLTTTATPPTATIGQPVADVAHLTGNNPTGTISFSLYGPNPGDCTGTPVQTVTTPVNGSGDYTSPSVVMTGAGTFVWVASYSGDANNMPLSNGCAEASETVTVSAPPPTPNVTPPPAPSFSLTKLQAIDNSGTAFTTAPIVADVGQKIDYQVIVTNTGNEPLNLALVDTMCTSIAGPTGAVTGTTLAVGGTATWTCSHVVVAADFPSYVNVAQVTGTPPDGTPLPPERASVVANIPNAGQLPACVASPLTIRKTTSNGGKTVNVIVSAGAKKVVFAVDGRTTKTLTKPNASGGRFELSIKVPSTRFGKHSVTTKATNACGKVTDAAANFTRNVPPKPVVPKFTG